MNPGDTVSQRLKSFIERLERLEIEKTAILADIKEVKSEAKGVGFDIKTINKILRERKLTSDEIDEEQSLLDLYRAALGMLHDTPLGLAARKRFEPSEDVSSSSSKSASKKSALEEPYKSAALDQARELGKADAKNGKPITHNPYPADDKRRAAWDEAWCAANGSDGMDIPEAWQRKKPAKKDDPKEGKK